MFPFSGNVFYYLYSKWPVYGLDTSFWIDMPIVVN